LKFYLLTLFLFSSILSGKSFDIFKNSRQLTFDGIRSGEGYFSKDDKFIIFQSENHTNNPFYQIYRLDLKSGETKLLSNGSGKTTCAWLHPFDNKFLYSSTHLDPEAKKKQVSEIKNRKNGKSKKYSWDYDEYYDIFIKDLDTNKSKRITQSRGYDAEGSISNDGNMVVFTSNRNAYLKNSNLVSRV